MRKLTGYGPSLIVLATATLVLVLGPTAVRQLTYKQTRARMIQATNRLESGNVLEAFNRATQDIADFVEPSVVHISAQQSDPERGGVLALSSGSGWIYDAEGHVVTNYHVVKDADRIEVQLNTGQLRPAEIVGADRSTDIAVLSIPNDHLHPAVLADMTDMVRQGDLVFAFGSPFDFKFSMSSGIVSGKGRSVEALGQGGYENFIQVDAAINPGNSGGPLTDFRGRVIGMNTAIATGRRSSLEEGQFAGIGLAIPLTMIEPVVTQIIRTGVVEKGWLGVEVQEVNRTTTARFGFSGEGVRISVVVPESPADLAGIRVNDIVTSVDGTTVASVPQLRSTISSILPGETTVLSIWRPDLADGAYEELSIPVRLARLDRLREFGELPPDQSLDRILEVGIAKMSTSTPALAAGMGTEHRPGVIIERVVADTGIALGIEEGMTITEVKGVPVRSTDDFIGQLRRVDLRNPVPVSAFGRDGSYGTTYLIVVR